MALHRALSSFLRAQTQSVSLLRTPPCRHLSPPIATCRHLARALANSCDARARGARPSAGGNLSHLRMESFRSSGFRP
eukprot:254460-Prorocentrum_minimum.AAC.1